MCVYWLSSGAIAYLNRREGQPAMFYIHPWEVDPDQPRIAASMLSRFRHYHHLDKCERRLDRLLAGAPFTKVETVLDDYRRRQPLARMRYDDSGVSLIAPPPLAVA